MSTAKKIRRTVPTLGRDGADFSDHTTGTSAAEPISLMMAARPEVATPLRV
jgi:hypothetical protein